MKPLILIGASGRVARRLRRVWSADGRPVVAIARDGCDADLAWSPGAPLPPLPQARDATAIVMAGVVPGPGRDVDANAAIAVACRDAARAWGARRILVLSSSAVYGATGPVPVSEDAAPAPANAYGAAKLAAERAAAGPDVTALRLANVAGASEPFLSLATVTDPLLDRFADGDGPRRSFIGPVLLARCLAALAGTDASLPPVLNVAARGSVAMADIFTAAGRTSRWRPAPDGAVQHVHLDVTALSRYCPVPHQGAADLLSQASETADPAR
ncbi:hypothetical protein OCGS_1987 [Oceaniovalibus guishaninsula JLT2003]|uniref:NAD-dependent epimerase/dehydratase domain-containing protein n=1 Tax=Oceaniovalibus guishaninsula JLT2003 TaxID=1231392 RepID=K2GMQ7_9RHOB|nr:NAD-dependent epimerase/dehydratase family protein [Oceaniovalibus guishaninsula]EKE44006.1 hypothetical protein OCGS_1987 [Oceaniovalibus guishaninsula JLT2003]